MFLAWSFGNLSPVRSFCGMRDVSYRGEGLIVFANAAAIALQPRGAITEEEMGCCCGMKVRLVIAVAMI
jgi:hypothetical protein